jgi:predicted RNase H-related nuclease YkuK (DUF458 family)
MHWRKFNGESINLPIKAAVEEAIKRETDKGIRLKVCIGTDSQVKGGETEFATVIVFLREHNGGFMYIHNEKSRHQYHIKERMLVEVAKSIELLMSFVTSSLTIVWIWKFMPTLILIPNLKATML